MEQLKYSTLAPSRYVVYLHPSEHRRLEGIFPIIRQQTVRALIEELEALNRPARWARFVPGKLSRPAAPVENAAADWHVEFVADANGELQEGDILIESELLLPASPELGVGEHTRKVTTRITSQGATTETDRRTEPVRVLARIAWSDNDGEHRYEMLKPSITIGRGRQAEPVDVKIASSPDVSRIHARVRYVAATGQFFLADLSALGTTINQREVPRGYDGTDDDRRENGKETPLPHQARIGLADTVDLTFDIVR
jgi:hypothetical protein